VEAERLDARNVALAVGALLVAIGLAGLVFLRFSRARDEARGAAAPGEREASRRAVTAVRTRPYPPVRGVDAIADLGVVGALAELADQLLG
jgi:hypothetical protein